MGQFYIFPLVVGRNFSNMYTKGSSFIEDFSGMDWGWVLNLLINLASTEDIPLLYSDLI